MPLLVIYNPVSGDRSARALFDDHVLPLLNEHNIIPDAVVSTERSGHAGKILADFLADAGSAADEQPVSVLLGSGDGTLHELINELNNAPTTKPLPRIHLALVPTGTANALYSSVFPPSPQDAEDPIAYKLQSVRAFASASPRSTPLNLAVSVLSPPPGPGAGAKQVSISAVVASTALHASILRDSEALRAQDPSIERFKTAARQNIARWYYATAKLFPPAHTGVVEVWDPARGAFRPHEASTEDDPIVDLVGPFAYFLATVNVDRLEPAFRIAPRAREGLEDGTAAVLDVVVVRPMSDPAYSMDSDEARAAFAQKTAAVLGAAYQDGAHIGLRYAEDGSVVAEGDGPTVVEYFRCGGWVWEPDTVDERAHLVCADGDILTIPPGGKVTCTAAAPMSDHTGFALYA